MVLDLRQVYENVGEKLEFSYELSADAVPEVGGRRLPDGAKVSGTVQNRAGIVSMKSEVSFAVESPCDRCLKDVRREMSFSSQHILVRTLSNTDRDDYIVTDGDRFETDELFVPDILLHIPAKILCSDGCKGLCPVCGADLNDGDCGCSAV